MKHLADDITPFTGTLFDLLHYHYHLPPKMAIPDVYKLLYQGVFGVGHLIRDRAAAARYLEQESSALVDTPNPDPLLEPVSPDGTMVRVNLRPFRHTSIPLTTLLDMMIESACETHGSLETFIERWRRFGNLIHQGKLPFDRAAFHRFHQQIEQADFPAMHHSDLYRATYLPAYRVVKYQFMTNITVTDQLQRINPSDSSP